MKKNTVFTVIMIIVLTMVSAACYAVSPQTATCAYVVNDGHDGRDTNIKEIVYPGQKAIQSDYTVIKYVPCNPRNFIINNGVKKNANKELIGDQNTLAIATTSSGVKVNVAASAFWTLNQNDKAMRDFYTVCHKYTCFSDADAGGSVNSSTPGWNSMLSENFAPAMEAAIRRAVYEVNDSVWQTNNPKEYAALAEKLPKYFADEVRARFGFTEDLFCGSGSTSGWPDEKKPGEGEFECGPVRFTIDSVDALPQSSDSGTAAQGQLNAVQRANAIQKYGEQAGFWLGVLDAIGACKDAKGTTCIFNIGNPDSLPKVNLPVVEPTPIPTATPTAAQ